MSSIPLPVARRNTDIISALGLVVLVIAVEYFARRFLLFWFPTLGALRTNDMLAAGLCYALLVWLTLPPARRTLAHILAALRDIAGVARTGRAFNGALAALAGVGLLSLIDRFVWGEVRLPSVVSPWRSDIVVLEPLAIPLAALSLLAVNGVVVPLAEEWLWRGLIQPRLAGALGAVPGLLLTSVLFSLKHAIIDASLGRLLAIVWFGGVMGVLAARYGWRVAAAAHVLANTLATLVALVINRGQV